jgi:hypothetical protein
MKLVLIVFTLAIAAGPCRRSCICESEPVVPTFVGYQQNEVDTIQVFQYHKGTNFSAPHDTLLLTADYSARTVIGDTILVVPQPAFPGLCTNLT